MPVSRPGLPSGWGEVDIIRFPLFLRPGPKVSNSLAAVEFDQRGNPGLGEGDTIPSPLPSPPHPLSSSSHKPREGCSSTTKKGVGSATTVLLFPPLENWAGDNARWALLVTDLAT
ncbi:uncharacterized protein PV09_02354 [Verruconis gallopava]|uniref:Uncharacterized protein n=1 Tax=Verruconis gallopava TaxID=253628 RepID=A0A0D2B5Y6_9PEZI|nr:uncharacterized protein PV09_02354 [Verruconis gallopava]KIW06644.1 hypothetical protein PV09_02354 [Verruconis gallopava]